MPSEKEIEAARAVLERRIYDEGGCEAEQVPAMVREMLEAAARVRAEDNGQGSYTHPTPSEARLREALEMIARIDLSHLSECRDIARAALKEVSDE